MFKNTLTALLFVLVASYAPLGCSSADGEVHVPTGDDGFNLAGTKPGDACQVPDGGDGTDTTQCPYYACYCKGGTEPVLCTDYCNGTCQGPDATCAFMCRNVGGVDHIGPALSAVCD